MRTCCAKGCTNQTKDGYGMCRRHWRMVPKPLANQIWASVGTPKNLELWRTAIEEVHKKEGGQEKLL